MKDLIIGVLLVSLCISCSNTEEGLIGEWEGKTERINSDGELFEAEISCKITSSSDVDRNVILTVAGTKYEFKATEQMDMLTYTDVQVENDSTGRSYINGYAELMKDTLLHFDHEVYAMKGDALLYSDKFLLDMVRE